MMLPKTFTAVVVAAIIWLLSGNRYALAQNESTDRNLTHVCIAFYNVENLFDTIHQSGNVDIEFTPQGSNNWDTQKYFEKLDRLAEVISLLGTELTADGPAIIGLAEIENEEVVRELVRQQRIRDRNYQVIFIKGRDARISNAIIYNPRYFEPAHIVSKPVIAEDIPDLFTRDHLIVSGKLLGEPMHVMVAHWPSRSGGERRSRPRRIAAAQSARQALDSVKTIDANAKIIFMGDLNDDPTDESVTKYLNVSGDRHNLSQGQLFNPFLDFFQKGIGTLAFNNAWNLFDQIMVSQSLVGIKPGSFRFHRAEVFNRPFLKQSTGRFQGYPFRSFGGGVYLGGYSDHFPTYIVLIREAK